MTPRDPSTLSPVRPSLANSRLIVRSASGSITTTSRPTSPADHDDVNNGESLRSDTPPSSGLPSSSVSLAVADDSLALVDDEQAAASANLDSEGATKLLRDQLIRSDSARLLRRKSKARLQIGTFAQHLSHLLLNFRRTVSKTVDDGVTRKPQRRYYILSSAGKPVFCSTDVDPEAASTHVGVMQAIISIFADDASNLRTIVADKVRISFLLKAPLYYVAVSEWAEPDSVLRSHLEYLHLQVVSVTSSTQLQKIFQERKNFDLRRLLAGTENQLFALIAQLQNNLAVMTNSLHVFKIEAALRDKVAHALLPPKNEESAFYAILLVDGRIVTLLRPKKHSVHPSDLHLLLNTVQSSPSLLKPNAETWIPICLPRFNSMGFLHALVTYLSESVGMLLLSNDREAFFNIREWKEAAIAKLRKDKLIGHLEAARTKQAITLGTLGIPGLRHFLYKSRPFVQVVYPLWEGIYEDGHNQERLVVAYYGVHDQLHRRPPATSSGRQPAKLVYLRYEQEAILGWISQAFELYLALSPLLPKAAAVSAAHSVLKWVRQHENTLFLANAPTF